jgi:hypothetical protein
MRHAQYYSNQASKPSRPQSHQTRMSKSRSRVRLPQAVASIIKVYEMKDNPARRMIWLLRIQYHNSTSEPTSLFEVLRHLSPEQAWSGVQGIDLLRSLPELPALIKTNQGAAMLDFNSENASQPSQRSSGIYECYWCTERLFVFYPCECCDFSDESDEEWFIAM